MRNHAMLALCFIFLMATACALVGWDPAWVAAKGKGLALVWGDKVFGRYFFNPEFWAVIAFTLTLERWIPAVPGQKTLGLSFFQDGVWFLYEAALTALVTGTYIYWLKAGYARHFDHLTIAALAEQPLALRLAVGILLLDFLYWLQHWLNHKVPWFWRLHAVHHSQPELNFFTDFRYHALEYLVRSTVLVLPFLLLQVDTPVLIGYAFFQRWYTRFYHGNIRTNLGPLRYLLVTPQSHRVHHSLDPRHADKNFGSLFSFWDYLFGTQYRGYDEYPATGIRDPEFPLEVPRASWRLLLTPLYQHLYPLRALFEGVPRALRQERAWAWSRGLKAWLLLLGAAAWLGFSLNARAVEPAAVSAAELRLRRHLAKVLPPRGLSLECVDLFVEGSSPRATEFAVRERHGGSCPGDPAVAPIVDRYRVTRKPWRLQRYDPIEDRWLAPTQF